MQKYLFLIFTTLSSAWASASAPVPLDACGHSQFTQSAGTQLSGGDGLTVFKKVCYVDASGSYALYLLVRKGNAARHPEFADAVQIQLVKLSNGVKLQSMARDASMDHEAGVAFLPELGEIGDIDGDGLIDAIIVYRFYTLEPEIDVDDGYSGRIKIITFYKGQKVVIRAVTGPLDGSRSTTASANFFTLPRKVQSHLIKKMKQMYETRQFGFDNSFGFNPRRE
jgi:hypothetical protein